MKRKKKRKGTLKKIILSVLIVTAVIILAALVWYFPASRRKWKKDAAPGYAENALLTLNPYSRPGKRLKEVNALVVHYVGNPGTSARANRNYFEHLWLPPYNPAGTKASSHFIVGLQGEVLQCIPTYEIAYANYPRNGDTVSVEVCHPDAGGEFSEVTYDSVIRLLADLCRYYGLDSGDLLRHYDVSGKNCPKYYAENEDAWLKLKADVQALLDQ